MKVGQDLRFKILKMYSERFNHRERERDIDGQRQRERERDGERARER